MVHPHPNSVSFSNGKDRCYKTLEAFRLQVRKLQDLILMLSALVPDVIPDWLLISYTFRI
jgi:hypothetical protein